MVCEQNNEPTEVKLTLATMVVAVVIGALVSSQGRPGFILHFYENPAVFLIYLRYNTEWGKRV